MIRFKEKSEVKEKINHTKVSKVTSNTLKKKNWYYRLSLQKRTALWGIIFLSPWIFGFLVFFLRPLIESFIYSFNTVSIADGGGLVLKFAGLNNYIQALTSDVKFNKMIITMIFQTLLSVPMVIIFSLLSAILLNGEYKGRALARAIFFIPIILATGATSMNIGTTASELAELTGDEKLFGVSFIINLLINSGINKAIVEFLANTVGEIFKIISISGVQILIFLAGLQSISPSLYEVAKIEGSTGYETFWKITIPMVSPMILICTVYSIVDSFLRSDITQRMYDVAFKESNYGLSSAMSCIYLIVNIIFLSIVGYFISKKVFYYD